MRILALDVGEKKIGLAVGDTVTRMAFTRPALLVQTWDDVWPFLKAFVPSDLIELVIVGWPMNTDGSSGPQTKRVQEFIDQLQKIISTPIITRDERNSSQAVQREQQAIGRTLPRGQEDSLAAQLFLETYLTESL